MARRLNHRIRKHKAALHKKTQHHQGKGIPAQTKGNAARFEGQAGWVKR